MASTYSSILKLELVATGEQAGTWGATNNSNLGTLIESAIAGTVSHSTAGAGDTTLSNGNGTAANEARYAVLNLTGVLTGNHNVICPAASKLYTVQNSTTGAYTVTFKTSAGTGIVVSQGDIVQLYCDGTNVVTIPNASTMHAATAKTPVVDADEIPIVDSAASWVLKKITLTTLWTWITTKAATALNIGGNAATVTIADAGGDATTFPLLGTAATGSLAPATDAGLTYNATTNALTTTTFIGALTGNADTATNATTAVTVSTTVASGAVGTTQAVGTNNTTLATTAYVMAAAFVNNDVGSDGVGSIQLLYITSSYTSASLASGATIAGAYLGNFGAGNDGAGVFGVFITTEATTHSGTYRNISPYTVYKAGSGSSVICSAHFQRIS